MSAHRKKLAPSGSDAPSFLKCPSNHTLPYKSPGGECTPLYCMASEAPLKPPPKAPSLGKKLTLRATQTATDNATDAIDTLYPPDQSDLGKMAVRTQANVGAHEEAASMGSAVGRRLARQQYLKAPEDLEGDEAERWAKAKMVALKPEAAVAYEEALKFGDRKERMEAARLVLDHDKKEAQLAHSAPIVIQIADPSSIRLPWAMPPIGSTTTAMATVVSPLSEPSSGSKQ